MDKKKSMVVNCDICDTRRMQENAYEKYDEIIINTDFVLVNERSKALLEKLSIVFNADEFIELNGDEDFNMPSVSVNGGYIIGNTVPAEDNIILLINGGLTITAEAEEALKHYYRISVNGGVLCPESLSSHLSRLSINGGITVYPDDYTLLKDNFVIDKYFPLRAAKDGRYFVRNSVKLIDKTVNVALLTEKNVRFKTKKLLVPEEKIEECVPLVDESTEFIVIPRGLTVADGNVKLNDELIKKYGSKIFVYGNLDASGDISDIIPKIETLVVTGKITLTKKNAEKFKEVNAEYNKIEIVKEIVLGNKAMVKINSGSLKLSNDGISVVNCGAVTIAKDVKPEDIMRLVDMKNIGVVMCSEEQCAAVDAVGENVGHVTTEFVNDAKLLLGKIIGSKIVNTDKYVM